RRGTAPAPCWLNGCRHDWDDAQANRRRLRRGSGSTTLVRLTRRSDSLEYLVSLGATADDLVAHRDELPGLAAVAAIRAGGALTLSAAVERSGVSEEKLLPERGSAPARTAFWVYRERPIRCETALRRDAALS